MNFKKTAFISIFCWFTGYECCIAEPQPGSHSPEVTINIKTGQWLNKSSGMTVKPTYTLDIFATNEPNPDIPLRTNQYYVVKKSKYFLKRIEISEHKDEGYTISVPANISLYLSSYFEQGPSLLSTTTRYCFALEKYSTEPNKKYILTTNFALLGPINGECEAKILTDEEFQRQITTNAELTSTAYATEHHKPHN
jgi:hypothetical protein